MSSRKAFITSHVNFPVAVTLAGPTTGPRGAESTKGEITRIIGSDPEFTAHLAPDPFNSSTQVRTSKPESSCRRRQLDARRETKKAVRMPVC
jgi:hypothetical protein